MRVLSLEYFRNEENVAFVRRLLDFLDAAPFSVAVNLLKKAH